MSQSTLPAGSTLYKLVVLGNDGVGKTALTIQVGFHFTLHYLLDLIALQLFGNHFVETYDPTIEDSYRKQAVVDGQPCMLDTAGKEDYNLLRDQWIRGSQGFILVYSITSKESFIGVQQFHDQIRQVKLPADARSLSSTGDSGVPAIPVMLVGNKTDKKEREVSKKDGAALAEKLG